jgi:hypothetical protein
MGWCFKLVVDNYRMRLSPFEKGAVLMRNFLFAEINVDDVRMLCSDDLASLHKKLREFISKSQGTLVEAEITSANVNDEDVKQKSGSSGTHFVKTSSGGPGEARFEIRYRLKENRFPFFEALHEVCHATYHIEDIEVDVPEPCGDSDWKDDECNFFARAVLMPAEEFRIFARNFFDFNSKKYDVREIARHYAEKFLVDQMQVVIRGRELGIWT